ncbi:MAG: DUF262 domain-containing protein [Clostridiales bacterium]|jgi:uncharacterized protein with ParB-like and HNH nuclease domain|nr:DUF262 domain-containing protein [Clostridiales bacterium]
MKATDVTVQDFIGGIKKAFIIPPYQRNYAWGEEQCDELYNDIINCIENDGSHYIGNVVYYLGENSGGSFQEMILIDGQQRITTILLLLCALRDISGDENLKGDINEQYLCNKRCGRVSFRRKVQKSASRAFLSFVRTRIASSCGRTRNEKYTCGHI